MVCYHKLMAMLLVNCVQRHFIENTGKTFYRKYYLWWYKICLGFLSFFYHIKCHLDSLAPATSHYHEIVPFPWALTPAICCLAAVFPAAALMVMEARHGKGSKGLAKASTQWCSSLIRAIVSVSCSKKFLKSCSFAGEETRERVKV